MKPLNKYIKEKLIINKNYRDTKIAEPKSFDYLRKIIEDRYDKLGAGTKDTPIDFNDIDVSNLDSFCNDKGIGLFEGIKFKYIDISDWDVSNVTNMSSMFFDCWQLKSVGDLAKWNVSNVTNISGMFYKCNELKFIGDISEWNVSNVIDMTYMFYDCESFNQDISDWDVSKVTCTLHMFHNSGITNTPSWYKG